MATTMRAAVVRQFRQPLVLEERPVPTPGPGEVVVRIVASGVCHTDLHAADGDWPVKPTLPFVPGHEGAGFVAAVGAGVRTVREGDRVGVPWLYSACGTCAACVGGWETLCTAQRNTGYSVDGGYADYVLADARFVGKLPATIDFVHVAPILCAGVTTYKGLKETEARPGQWVVVSGVGGLGHLAIQYARAMGLEVAALDIGEEKLSLARGVGATIAIDARAPDAAAAILEHTGGGAHGALVTAVSPAAVRQTLGFLRSGGTCVLVGLPPGDFAIPIFDVVLKRLTIRGSIVGTRLDLSEALAFAGTGKVAAAVEARSFEQVNEVMTRLREGRVRGRIALTMT